MITRWPEDRTNLLFSFLVHFGELIERNGTYPTLNNTKADLTELKEIKSEVEMLIKMLDLINAEKSEKTTGVETVKKTESEELHQLIAEETTGVRHKRAAKTSNQRFKLKAKLSY